MVVPLPVSLRQVLVLYKSYLVDRLSAVVKPWISAPTDNDIANKPPRAIFTKPTNLWPCGSKDKPLVLSFSFFRQTENTIQRNRESKIQAVIRHLEERVPGVKFDRVNKDSDAAIRIAFNHEHPYGRTWSEVGRKAERVNSDEPTMNLSDVRDESGKIQEGSKEYGDIMHEFFHTLGMPHGHQHPDRKFAISATAVGKEDDGWSEKDIVRRFNPNTIGYSPPDIASCINYHTRGEWIEEWTKDCSVNKPSDLDFAWLNLMYPPSDPTKFEQALSESIDSRISKEHRNAILKLYQDGEWDRVRSKIMNISNPKSKSSRKHKSG